MRGWEAYREVDPRVQQLTGYRYCTAVRLGYDGCIGDAVLLTGQHPYDAARVEQEMTARGYGVHHVDAASNDHVAWQAKITGFGDRRAWQQRALVYVHPGDWHDWRNVIVGDVFFDFTHHTWTRYTVRESLDDDDRQLLITMEQAERIARLLPEPLPDQARRQEIHQYISQLWERRNNRYEDLYDRRAEQFSPVRERLHAQAQQLAGVAPARAAVDHLDPAVIAGLPAVDVALDEPFPLLQHMYGSFGDSSWFTAAKVRVATAAGPVTVTLTVWMAIRTLNYLAVTPFCPGEGYPLDTDDTDPALRAAKLDGPQGVWGCVDDPDEWLPASPARLWILSDTDRRPTGDSDGPGADLWLHLDFGPAGGYLSAPNPYRRGHDGQLIYQEFVPAGAPDLAEVPGLAPRWVSINIPPYPDLLKTVTARLRFRAGRPHPHRGIYVEE